MFFLLLCFPSCIALNTHLQLVVLTFPFIPSLLFFNKLILNFKIKWEKNARISYEHVNCVFVCVCLYFRMYFSSIARNRLARNIISRVNCSNWTIRKWKYLDRTNKRTNNRRKMCQIENGKTPLENMNGTTRISIHLEGCGLLTK